MECEVDSMYTVEGDINYRFFDILRVQKCVEFLTRFKDYIKNFDLIKALIEAQNPIDLNIRLGEEKTFGTILIKIVDSDRFDVEFKMAGVNTEFDYKILKRLPKDARVKVYKIEEKYSKIDELFLKDITSEE